MFCHHKPPSLLPPTPTITCIFLELPPQPQPKPPSHHFLYQSSFLPSSTPTYTSLILLHTLGMGGERVGVGGSNPNPQQECSNSNNNQTHTACTVWLVMQGAAAAAGCMHAKKRGSGHSGGEKKKKVSFGAKLRVTQWTQALHFFPLLLLLFLSPRRDYHK